MIDASVWDASLVRQALDELLRRYPMFDLISIDWQWADDFTTHGVWVIVKLGQRSSNFEESPAWTIWPFAIFKATGALHGFEGEGDDYPGAVSDDPIWTPGDDDVGHGL